MGDSSGSTDVVLTCGVDQAVSGNDVTVVEVRFARHERCFRFAGTWPEVARQMEVHDKRARGRERYRRRYGRIGRKGGER